MAEMPRRPGAHDLETGSVRAFENAIPHDWVSAPHGADVEYGVDRDVEIFEDGSATGELFHVQLKAAADLDGRPARVRIKRTTWNYWRRLDLPVLLVHWERSTGALRWMWTHEHDTYGGDESATLTLAPHRVWDAASAAAVASVVRAWRAWKNAASLLPLPLEVSAASDTGRVPGARVVAAVRRLALTHPGIFAVRRAAPGEVHFSVHVGRETSVVTPLGSAPTTLHHPDLPSAETDGSRQRLAELLAADLMHSAGMLLARLGAEDAGARIVENVLSTCSVVRHPTVVGDTLALLFETNRPDEAVRLLAKTLTDQQTPELVNVAIIATMVSSVHIDDAQRGKVSRLLETIAADQASAQGDSAAGPMTYNAARFSGLDDIPRTIRLYDLAAARQPAYERRAYWQRERAGLSFHLGDFETAATGYACAVSLGDVDAKPLLADSLMFAGRYVDALDLFTAIETTDADWSPEWELKRRVLRYFVADAGIDRQTRNPARADARAEGATTKDDLMAILVEDDAMSGRTQWELGNRRLDENQPALLNFLAAAVSTHDAASWFNAILRSVAEDPGLLEAVTATARRFAGHQIIDLLLTSNRPNATEHALMVETMFDALPPDAPSSFEVRAVGDEPDPIAILDIFEAFGGFADG